MIIKLITDIKMNMCKEPWDMTIRNIMMYISILYILIFLGSCNQKKGLSGSYVYIEENKNSSEISMWTSVCASIGTIDFKNGKMYYTLSVFGIEQPMKEDYHIDGNIIYVSLENSAAGGVGAFEILNDSTLLYKGTCEFRKTK